EKVKSKNKLFLQHGVIASKDVSGIYGRTQNNEFTNLFVVSSEREKYELMEKYNYTKQNTILIGHPKLDNIIMDRKTTKVTKKEKYEMIEKYNYTEKNTIHTGLPRFDNNIMDRKTSKLTKNHILIMTT